MDALSSMATICGYKAVVIAADTLPRLFPMLTTAAGTITPARVLVIGAGVAGLQAIATARRLGAVASAYDLRPAAKEQVQSLGGRFVELPIEAKDAQDARGYARAQDETFYQRQRELLGRVVAESDVVITAAVVPGTKSPVLVTREMVADDGARFGDRRSGGRARRQLRADARGRDRGRARRHHHRHRQPGQHACRTMPARCTRETSARFCSICSRTATLSLNLDDPIVGETLLTRGGDLVNPRVREFCSLPPLAAIAERVAQRGGRVTSDLMTNLYVFMLAAFIGFEVIRRVSPLLHTPLMSLTNALDAIAVVGAIVLAGEDKGRLTTVLATVAVVAATSNVVGGFLITDRMLRMFKSSKTPKP